MGLADLLIDEYRTLRLTVTEAKLSTGYQLHPYLPTSIPSRSQLIIGNLGFVADEVPAHLQKRGSKLEQSRKRRQRAGSQHCEAPRLCRCEVFYPSIIGGYLLINS